LKVTFSDQRVFREQRGWPFQAASAVVLHLLASSSRQQYITQIMKEWKTFSFAHKLARIMFSFAF